jgi:ubiquinone/menaquinone biosynthesis C-methylase UbiE
MGRSDSLYTKARAVLVPGLENSQFTYARSLRRALSRSERWLDVGCGHAIFPDWVGVPWRDLGGATAVGLDLDRGALEKHHVLRLRVEGDGERLPFGDAAFDLVTANMVLEHVRQPASLFDEVARVLTPGGHFLVHTPNARGYTTMLTRLIPRRLRAPLAYLLQGRLPDDVYPTYYRANRPSALRRLAANAGLRTEDVEYVQTSPQLIAVAPLMLGEMMVIRALSLDTLARFRACLICGFRKPA